MAAFYSPETGVENFITRFPVLAVDEAAKTMGINFSSVTFERDAATQGVTNIGNAPMQNGIAFIPVTFTSSDPKTIKLALARKGLKIDSSASIGSVKPDPRVKPRFIVVVIAYEVVQVGYAAAVLASAVILEQLSKQRGATLPEVDFTGLTSWFAEAGNKIQSAVATVTNYVTVAIHASSGNAPLDVPFVFNVKPYTAPAEFNNCKDVSTWQPPIKGSAEYNRIKDQISNRKFGDPPLIDSNPTDPGARSKFIDAVQNKIAKESYAIQGYVNRIISTLSQISELKSLNKSSKILSQAVYDAELLAFKVSGASKPPVRVGLYGHVIELWQNGVSIAKYIRDRGFRKDPDKKNEKVFCFGQEELDYLSILFDIIEEIVNSYNIKW